MQISISGTPGDYWINTEGVSYGPFENLHDASSTVVQMVTDRADAEYGNNVYFLEGLTK